MLLTSHIWIFLSKLNVLKAREYIFILFFSLSIVDLQCLLISAVQQSNSVVCVCVCIYIHTHTFSYSFPLWFITGYRIQFAVLYNRTLLFIHSIYTSLHLLIPNSQSIPSPAPPWQQVCSIQTVYLLCPSRSLKLTVHAYSKHLIASYRKMPFTLIKDKLSTWDSWTLP